MDAHDPTTATAAAHEPDGALDLTSVAAGTGGAAEDGLSTVPLSAEDLDPDDELADED